MGTAKLPLDVIFGAVDKLSPTMGKVGRGFAALGKNATRAGKTMTSRVSLPIVAAGAAIIATGVNFETKMNRVKALSGATGDEIAALRNKALELGADSPVSATAAAEGMTFLGQAGFKAAQQLGAASSLVALSTGTMTEMAETADILTDGLKGFGRDLSTVNSTTAESAKIADLYAGAVTNATTDLATFQEGIKIIAPGMTAANQSMEDTFTLMTALSDIGVKGTLGGTKIKRGLIELIALQPRAQKTLAKLGVLPEEVFDQDGKLKPLIGTLKRLGETGASQRDFLDIFGARAFLEMEKLSALAASGDLDKLKNQITQVGIAGQLSAGQMEGAPGQFARFKAGIEKLSLAINSSGLLEDFGNLLDRVRVLATEASDADPKTLRLWTMIALGAAVLGPVLIALGGLSTIIGTLVVPAVALMTKGIIVLGVAILTNPVGLIVTGIIALGAAIWALTKDLPGFQKVWKVVFDTVADIWNNTFGLIWKGIKKLGGFIIDKLGGGLGGVAEDLFDPVDDNRLEAADASIAHKLEMANAPFFLPGGAPGTQAPVEVGGTLRVDLNNNSGLSATLSGEGNGFDIDTGAALSGT